MKDEEINICPNEYSYTNDEYSYTNDAIMVLVPLVAYEEDCGKST